MTLTKIGLVSLAILNATASNAADPSWIKCHLDKVNRDVVYVVENDAIFDYDDSYETLYATKRGKIGSKDYTDTTISAGELRIDLINSFGSWVTVINRRDGLLVMFATQNDKSSTSFGKCVAVPAQTLRSSDRKF